MSAPVRDARAARARFLWRMERLIRLWVWVLGAGMAAVLLGLSPSVLAAVGLLGVVWVPIVALVLWGRLLDETMPFRGDGDRGGCQ